jgi:prepilin-type processing-associated H-X9-DG protein
MGHLGYPNVYNAINFHWPMGESYLPAFPPNTTAESMMISLLLCPSDYHAKIRTTGKCSYRYSVGTQDHAPLLALPGAGAFTVYDWAQPGDFPAGLANTAAMSEKVSGDLDIDSYDKLSDAGLVSETLQAKPLDEIVAGCAEQAVYPNVSHAGWSWIQSLYLSNWYNHIVTPNHAVGDCVAYDQRVLIFAHNAVGIFAPRSAHGSGANCMMMDGSVRFVGRDMDLGAWRALGTRAADD